MPITISALNLAQENSVLSVAHADNADNLIRTVLPMIKNLGMSVVRAVAPTLFNTEKRVLFDVLAGKNFKSRVIYRHKKAGEEVISKAARYLSGDSGGAPGKRRQTAQGGRRANRMKTTLF